jgi:hypothetical protein
MTGYPVIFIVHTQPDKRCITSSEEHFLFSAIIVS